MLRANAYILVLILCQLFYAVFAADIDENSLYEDCKRVYVEGKISEVCEKSERFIEAFPQSQHRPEIMFMQAKSEPLINIAVQKYRLLIAEYPENKGAENAHIELIKCYYLLSQYDEALKHYQEMPPPLQNDNIRYWIAKCLLSKGEYEAGVAILHNLRGIRGYKITLGAADSYFGKQEYDYATELYKWVIKTSQEDAFSASARAQLCKIFQQTGKSEKAQECYQKIIKEYPRTPEAQLARFRLQELPLYVVQLGAFSKKESATTLVDLLKDKKYSAYFTVPEDSGDNFYKVRIGPFRNRGDAEKAASKLRENDSFAAIILAQPTD